ncbi:MAG: hypothetical protein ACTSQ2_03205 [Candidatus Heimdallarchaeaceae archaeon]
MAEIDTRVILPIISIMAMGFLIVDVFKKKIMKINSSDSRIDYFIESLIFGTISLVVPMLIISIIADKIENTTILERFVYLYITIAFAYLIFKIYRWVRKKLPELVLKKKKVPQGIETLFTVIIGLMIIFFTLQGLVYPLRGWDFLHFYLPNSFRIYLTGQLGMINELNFMPQFKPPVNILLFAYGFFVTQAEMIHLIPILFLVGTVFLCYKIAKLEGLTKKSSLLSSIALLATPFTFFLVYEFQYYQEIYITFFTTAAYFFFRKSLKSETVKSQFYNALLASLALSGCVLSKISGFVIPLVILVAMPSDMVGKVIRSIIVVGFAFQLIRKSIFEVYLGTGILIFLLCAFCIYLIFSSETLKFSYKRWLFVLGIYSLPLIAAVLWGLHLLSIPGVQDFLINIYIDVPVTQISLSWTGIALPETTTYLENAHTATFVSSSFSILIATMFAGTWLFFKIFGFIKAHKKNNELMIWLIFFFVFWQGFFAMGSIRYLSPILVPLTILFVIGIDSVVSFFNKRDGQKRDGFLASIFILASAYLSLYPALPFEIISEDFHLRWYHAHTHIWSLLGYIILFNLLTFTLIWKEKQLKIDYSQIFTKKFNFRKIISGFLIFILFFTPFLAQFALLIDTGFDLDEFNSKYCYFTRETYQELVDSINRLGYPDNLAILTINTPGLEYYTSQPVIDLFMLGFIENSGLANSTFPLGIENVTRTLEFFEQYDLSIFVALNTSNDWYNAYQDRIYWNYFIYRFINNNEYFTWRFSNQEFIMYTISSYDPYVGPVDFQLSGPINKGSLLARSPNPIEISGDMGSIGMELDITAAPTTGLINVSISTEYSTFTNSTISLEYQNYQMFKTDQENFLKLTLLSLPTDSIFLHSINIDINYLNSEGFEEEKSYSLLPFQGASVNITRLANSWLYEGFFGFVYT